MCCHEQFPPIHHRKSIGCCALLYRFRQVVSTPASFFCVLQTPRLLSFALKHDEMHDKTKLDLSNEKQVKGKKQGPHDVYYWRVIALRVRSRSSASQHPRLRSALFVTCPGSPRPDVRRACVSSMHRSC